MVLNKNYKMMIDFKEFICDTDGFVMCNIFDMLSKGVNLPFKKLIPLLLDINPADLPLIKTNVNPLVEYIDEESIDSADNIYDNILYFDYNVERFLRFTTFAKALIPLVSHKDLEVIYIYVGNGDFDVTGILRLIDNFYNSPKIRMVAGNKKDFIDKYPCDLYAFQDANDVKLLNPTTDTDVIVSNHKFNKEIVKDIKHDKLNIYMGTVYL